MAADEVGRVGRVALMSFVAGVCDRARDTMESAGVHQRASDESLF